MPSEFLVALGNELLLQLCGPLRSSLPLNEWGLALQPLPLLHELGDADPVCRGFCILWCGLNADWTPEVGCQAEDRTDNISECSDVIAVAGLEVIDDEPPPLPPPATPPVTPPAFDDSCPTLPCSLDVLEEDMLKPLDVLEKEMLMIELLLVDLEGHLDESLPMELEKELLMDELEKELKWKP